MGGYVGIQGEGFRNQGLEFRVLGFGLLGSYTSNGDSTGQENMET